MAGRGKDSPFGIFVAVMFILFLATQLEQMGGLDFLDRVLDEFPMLPLIAAFILFRIVTSRNEKKRGPVPIPMPVPEAPTEQPKDLGFKIPTLKGAPKDARTEEQEAQEVEEDLDALRRESYERHLAEKQEREQKMEEERLKREHQTREIQTAASDARRFSSDGLRSAVIWSEVLAPPKALRRR